MSTIQTQLIDDIIELPEHLKILDGRIEIIELKIRDLIVDKFGNNIEDYFAIVPQHIQDKVKHRISLILKKNPSDTLQNYNSFSSRIEHFDVSEYLEIIVSKANWNMFEYIFNDKNQLQIRFNQFGTLRNGIRHSRSVNEIEQLDGEASIKWFNSILK